MTVNRERVELWAQALESERYVKCEGSLRLPLVQGTRHCALGVGMEVAQAHGVIISPLDWVGQEMSPVVREWYGLRSSNPWLDLDEGRHALVTSVNDRLRLPFWDIAQLLRAKYVKEEQ